jgi:hypothetical protein
MGSIWQRLASGETGDGRTICREPGKDENLFELSRISQIFQLDIHGGRDRRGSPPARRREHQVRDAWGDSQLVALIPYRKPAILTARARVDAQQGSRATVD